MEYPEYYKILELPIDAELADIKRQYRKFAKKYHPDLNKGDKNAEEMFKKIKEAYETLIDDNKRASYDLSWRKQRKTEQKARRESQKTAREQKVKKNKPEPKPRKAPVKKKSEKPVRKSATQHSFFKVLRVFFFSSLICGILLFMIAQFLENKEKLFKIIPNFTEMSDGVGNYVLKQIVLKDDVAVARRALQKNEHNNTQDIINIKNSDGYSLLMMSKTADMSQLLIENGADVNYIAPDGTTALLLAVKNNNKEQIETLLKAGAKAEVKDLKSGYNALMLSQSNDIAYLLLKAGANPNFVAEDGLTPLSKATKEHDRQRLNLLHQFGAQINWSDVIRR